MLSINQLKLPINHTEADIKAKIIKELNLRHIKDMPSFDFNIIRRSVDARKKPDIFYIYTVAVIFDKAGNKDVYLEKTILKKCRNKNVAIYEPVIYTPKFNIKHSCKRSPVIVGEGPSGLFCGLILAYAGLKPIIVERGDKVEKRVEKVREFWLTGSINENTNVQFGEGGAGTFSDGKLNTLVKDKSGMNRFVLDTFVKFGADKECAYDAKPHVGTEILEKIVRNLREEIINHGGQIHNLCKLTDLVVKNNKLDGIIVDNLGSIKTDDLVLAIGHSARDTFNMLYNHNLDIRQKNFAVGVRILHPQNDIDDSQYGTGHDDTLPPSSYKLTNHTQDGRDVFSFCMCPGGYVINASSARGHTCVNGMSYSKRDSGTANAAIIASVTTDDFCSDHPLAGVFLQEELEKKAFELGEGKIPIQLYGDYKEGKVSEKFGEVKPKFKGYTKFADINEILPEYINHALIESIDKFGYTIEGFNRDDAIIAAVESRTSSPVRIVRDENFESNVKGIYPCGEGCGYAGGIMSAAMDGIKVAEAIIKRYLQ